MSSCRGACNFSRRSGADHALQACLEGQRLLDAAAATHLHVVDLRPCVELLPFVALRRVFPGAPFARSARSAPSLLAPSASERDSSSQPFGTAAAGGVAAALLGDPSYLAQTCERVVHASQPPRRRRFGSSWPPAVNWPHSAACHQQPWISWRARAVLRRRG